MSHHLNNQVTSVSDLYSRKPELSELKNHKINSGVFEGKFPSDYESAWSPTSPFDFRLFSSFGNPFGGSSPRSRYHQKSWDSGKVGLSIVDSLDDHHTGSPRMLPPSPDSKNIIFGSWMRTLNPKCLKHHLPNHMVEEQTPGSLNGHIECDIETSEDYTCVISHGPNPKTIHFYGDRVLESVEFNRMKKLCCENKKESIFVIEPLDLTEITDVLPSDDDLLSFCCFCRKKLGMGKDLYMYRGYIAFCSSECRLEEIHLNGEMEEEEDEAKSGSFSDKDMSKKKSDGLIFTIC